MKVLTVANDLEHQKALDETGFWGRKGAGCIFVSLKSKRILLAHRSRHVETPNTWGTWGGAIDSDETFEQGMKREIVEETQYHGRYELFPLFLFKHASGFRYQNFMAVVNNEFTPRLDWENQGFKWVEFGDWPNPLHHGLRDLLEDKHSVEKIKLVLDL